MKLCWCIWIINKLISVFVYKGMYVQKALHQLAEQPSWTVVAGSYCNYFSAKQIQFAFDELENSRRNVKWIPFSFGSWYDVYTYTYIYIYLFIFT